MTPLEIAIRTEEEGKQLYIEAASKAANPMAGEIFAFLIREEDKHLTIILKYAKAFREKGELPEAPAAFGDLVGLKTVFTDALKEVKTALPIDSDDMAALERAMEFEQRGQEYYETAAGQAMDSNERNFFSILAREERGHYMVLLDSREALKDPEAWLEKASKIGLDGA